MALFCAAIGKDSVFLLRYPFLSLDQVFSREVSREIFSREIFLREISPICHLKYPYRYDHFLLLMKIQIHVYLLEYFYYLNMWMCYCKQNIWDIFVVVYINYNTEYVYQIL